MIVSSQNTNTMLNNITLPKLQGERSPMTLFLMRFAILYALWEIIFHIIWQSPALMTYYRDFSIWVIGGILQHTDILLSSLGYVTEIDVPTRVIRLVGTGGVTVGEPCIGFGVMALFVGLITAYPAFLSKKLWFIPLGLMAIYGINLIRIGLLCVLSDINPLIWEFNHKFLFKIVVYSLIFGLWCIWLKILAKK